MLDGQYVLCLINLGRVTARTLNLRNRQLFLGPLARLFVIQPDLDGRRARALQRRGLAFHRVDHVIVGDHLAALVQQLLDRLRRAVGRLAPEADVHADLGVAGLDGIQFRRLAGRDFTQSRQVLLFLLGLVVCKEGECPHTKQEHDHDDHDDQIDHAAARVSRHQRQLRLLTHKTQAERIRAVVRCSSINQGGRSALSIRTRDKRGNNPPTKTLTPLCHRKQAQNSIPASPLGCQPARPGARCFPSQFLNSA